MPTSVHSCLTVFIWGLTWTAIRLQVEAALALVGNYVLFRRTPLPVPDKALYGKK